MSYDPLTLCKDQGDYFEVDPAVMFPGILAHIQDCVKGTDNPTDVMTPGWEGRPDREPVADKFMRQAEAFKFEDFKLDTPAKSAVLELAESWFKRALVVKAGRGIRLHISRNADYRR